MKHDVLSAVAVGAHGSLMLDASTAIANDDIVHTTRRGWSAVLSMAMGTAMLIAAEFMPVSLLTPIAADLHTTDGMAGQAISISGLFAVVTSLGISSATRKPDRRLVLVALTTVMLGSLVLIASARSFATLMVARALLGVTVGGFWALATATVMRLVAPDDVPRALGVLYTGNAMATAFAAPIGSFVGGLIGWRGVFIGLVPFVAIAVVWQWMSLPSLPHPPRRETTTLIALLRRRVVAVAMLAVMLTFGGAFTAFTYFRPFLEQRTNVDVTTLSVLLLGLGVAGFVGTWGAGAVLGARLFALLRWLPLALSTMTIALLIAGRSPWATGVVLFVWGALNAAIPMAWSTWLARTIKDDPDTGGGLLVAAIQLSILLGAAFGGLLLDHASIDTTMIGGALLLVAAGLVVGNGARIGARA